MYKLLKQLQVTKKTGYVSNDILRPCYVTLIHCHVREVRECGLGEEMEGPRPGGRQSKEFESFPGVPHWRFSSDHNDGMCVHVWGSLFQLTS